jgi:hypothetical protein
MDTPTDTEAQNLPFVIPPSLMKIRRSMALVSLAVIILQPYILMEVWSRFGEVLAAFPLESVIWSGNIMLGLVVILYFLGASKDDVSKVQGLIEIVLNNVKK